MDKVYVMLDVFSTPACDKVVGVYLTLEDAVNDANNYISDDGKLVAIPQKMSKTYAGHVYAVVDNMGNKWFYIVERSVLKMNKECIFCREVDTGVCNESLIEDDLKFFDSAEMYLGVDVFIIDNELELYLDDPSGAEVLKRKISINYCPICGRNINNAAERIAAKVRKELGIDGNDIVT